MNEKAQSDFILKQIMEHAKDVEEVKEKILEESPDGERRRNILFEAFTHRATADKE